MYAAFEHVDTADQRKVRLFLPMSLTKAAEQGRAADNPYTISTDDGMIYVTTVEMVWERQLTGEAMPYWRFVRAMCYGEHFASGWTHMEVGEESGFYEPHRGGWIIKGWGYYGTQTCPEWLAKLIAVNVPKD